MLPQHRVLVATDLPFWRGTTGAEQRILSLVRFLQPSELVRVFYLSESTDLSQNDQRAIQQYALDVRPHASSQIPKHWWNRVRWYTSAIANALRPNESAAANDPNQSFKPMKLEDFRWPWAINAFGECVSEFQPTVILIEYIKLAYLLEGLTSKQRDDTFCALDTHDILSERNEKFQQRGMTHWLDVDSETEARAIAQFDLAIAIQALEAEKIRSMCPDTNVITCGHAVDFPANVSALPETTSQNPNELVLGHMASANAANVDSLDRFLKNHWTYAIESCSTQDADKLKLVIAGNICEHLDLDSLSKRVVERIECLGFVQDPAEFYQRVSLCVNPIEFGTGLKIKNLESLAFGKPLLTTSEGIRGMQSLLDSVTPHPVKIFNTEHAFGELIQKLLDPNELNQLCDLARRFRESGLSRQPVYGQLQQSLAEVRKLS